MTLGMDTLLESPVARHQAGPSEFRLPVDPIAATQLVRAIQDAVDTSRCTVLGQNWWLLIRNEIYYSISREVAKFFNAIVGKPGYEGRVYSGQRRSLPREFAVIRGAERSALFGSQDVSVDDLKGGVAFCEVPGDYTQFIDGLAVNCFLDPLMELMLEHANRTGPLTKLCRFQPRVTAVDKLVEPLYFFHNSSAGMLGGTDVFADFCQTIYEVNRYLYQRDIPVVVNPSTLVQQLREILSYQNAFVDIFDEIEPRLVFVQNFGNVEKLGAISAAKRLGIRTVDIQHGIQENTSMYNCHPAHCDDGSYVYPEVLWCWGQITTEALQLEQSRQPVPWKLAVEGGHPWKSLVNRQGSRLRLAKLKRQLPADRPVALYCHDPALINHQSVIGLLPGEIFEAIRDSADDIFWLVRLHPRAAHLIGEVQDFCNAHRLFNVEVEHSSTLLTEQVMEAADVLLTKFSVSALEAMSVGLPVVSHSWIGEVTFENYRDHPLLSFALEPADIIKAIHEAKRSAEPFRYVNTDTDESVRTFFSLLDR